MDKIKKEFNEIDSELEKLKWGLLYNSDAHKTKFTGYAYVVFDEQKDAKLFYKEWSLGVIASLFLKIIKCFNCCKFGYRDYKGKTLEVKWAPAPTDILWENLGYSKKKKFLRKLLTLFLTLIVMFGSFCLIV